MPRVHRHSFSIFIGISGIIIGAFYLAKTFGYLPGVEVSHYWPILLIIFGITRVIHPRSSSSYFWGPVFVATGALFMAHYLHYFPIDPQRLWPVLLIVFGLWTLLRSVFGFHRCRNISHHGMGCGEGKFHHGNRFAESILDDNNLDISLAMSGGKYVCTGKEFSGGFIRLKASGVELDLTNAETSLTEIVINVDMKLGGLEMRIPRTWKVSYLGKTTMGSVKDLTTPAVGSSIKLIIKGELTLAGIEIRN